MRKTIIGLDFNAAIVIQDPKLAGVATGVIY